MTSKNAQSAPRVAPRTLFPPRSTQYIITHPLSQSTNKYTRRTSRVVTIATTLASSPSYLEFALLGFVLSNSATQVHAFSHTQHVVLVFPFPQKHSGVLKFVRALKYTLRYLKFRLSFSENTRGTGSAVCLLMNVAVACLVMLI
jgi:hypothetical protein